MKIVTGYTGTPHITSNAVQAFNQGILGSGNYVLKVGQKFAATLTDANTVTVADGEGVIQGVHFRIDPGTTETVTIASGTTGYKRHDLICARYTKNAITGVENVSLVAITGTPDQSSPESPEYNTGNILNGDTSVDFPLFSVYVNGLTPSLISLFESSDSIDSLLSRFINFKTAALTGTNITTGEIQYTIIGTVMLFFANVKPSQNTSTLGNVYVSSPRDFDMFISSTAYPVSDGSSSGGIENIEAWSLDLDYGFHISGSMTSGKTYSFGGIALVAY